mgnify:CR=1 FL=1
MRTRIFGRFERSAQIGRKLPEKGGLPKWLCWPHFHLLICKLWIFFRNLMYVNLILRTLMRESCMHERDHTVHIQRL